MYFSVYPVGTVHSLQRYYSPEISKTSKQVFNSLMVFRNNHLLG